MNDYTNQVPMTEEEIKAKLAALAATRAPAASEPIVDEDGNEFVIDPNTGKMIMMAPYKGGNTAREVDKLNYQGSNLPESEATDEVTKEGLGLAKDRARFQKIRGMMQGK